MTTNGEPVDFKKLKVQELRDELKNRGLDTTGVKAVLLARLEEAASGSKPAAATEHSSEPASTSAAATDTPAEDKANPEQDAAPAASAPAAVSTEAPAVKSQETEAEKAKKRLERFGIGVSGDLTGTKLAGASNASTANGKSAMGIAKAAKADPDPEEIAKRKDRAKRFGTAAPVFASEELDKRKARAMRFDMPEQLSSAEQKDKLNKRKERFGALNGAAKGSARAADAAKLDSRAKRFGSGSIGSAEHEAKKQARAERFGGS